MHGAKAITTTAQEVIPASTYWDICHLFNNSDETIYVGFYANPGTLGYIFDSDTDLETTVVAGKIKFNATLLRDVTQLQIHQTDSDSADRTFELAALLAGQSIALTHLGLTCSFLISAAVDSGA